ncbi:MAG: AAA family ATPase, partial [Chloroflexota bacterium]
MKFRISSLDLVFKKDDDVIKFDDITYFYGKMGAGKTSIAHLIDYCLGGDFDLSPALQSEFVSVKLNLVIEGNILSLERVRESDQIVALWVKDDEK